MGGPVSIGVLRCAAARSSVQSPLFGAYFGRFVASQNSIAWSRVMNVINGVLTQITL